MRWVVYFFGSGLAFFIGVLFVWSGICLMACGRRRWQRGLATVTSLLGVMLFVLSATPIPYWIFGICVALFFAWIIVEHSSREQRHSMRMCLRIFAALAFLVVVAMELPYQVCPKISLGVDSPLYVIGDSVTAGMGEGEAETWPKVLVRSHQVEIHDFSRMGATAASAIRQADGVPATGGVVLVEIGGNDLLGSTTVSQFETHLDELLRKIAYEDRSILMFELPLPPFCNAYGEIQRRLAAKYRVHLVPKRTFASVLTGANTTVDSIHLSQAGHNRMAEIVWSLMKDN